MMRRRNNLTCNLFVQRTQGKLLLIMLNNKVGTYCTGKLAGRRWSKLLMPVKTVGVDARGMPGG